jgi:glucosyl-3-phosphoglycerate synthase
MPSAAAERWLAARTFHHSLYPPERIATERRGSVAVCLPARECAASVAQVVGELARLRRGGAIDEILLVDANSRDGTARVAERAGARVVQEAELMPERGPVLGKGDAMWRSLSVIDSELVCFVDADTEAFSAHFVTGLLGPLVCEPGVAFVKGFYRRPLGGEADGGGRVNHLAARPALSVFYPDLAGVRQPLAGEIAATRELLESVPFVTGYGVEIAMLIDVLHTVGLDAIAQVDLDEHRNPHKPLTELAPMALTVIATVARRMEQEGRLTAGTQDERDGGESIDAHVPLERPPFAGAKIA